MATAMRLDRRIFTILSKAEAVTDSDLDEPSTAPDARAIRFAVDAAIARLGRRDVGRVEIHVDGDIVRMTGHVRSFDEKRAVRSAVRNTPGVRQVVDDSRYDPFL